MSTSLTDGVNKIEITNLNPTPSESELVQDISLRTSQLVEILNENLNQEEVAQKNRDLILAHLDTCYAEKSDAGSKALNSISMHLDPACQWINSSEPIKLSSDSNGITVLEFFTHCCINCIHSIQDLKVVYKEIQEKYRPKNPLKIISVHSPKFPNEKNLDSVSAFVEKNGMSHTSVVNDPECALWNKLGIYCWPTLLVFGPCTGPGLNLLFALCGEGQRDILRMLIESSIEYLQNAGFRPKLPEDVSEDVPEVGQDNLELRFPGKISLKNQTLAISDSGNHRIIVCDLNGAVAAVIGGHSSGYNNSDFEQARFCNPQGIAFINDNIFYVADTGNHAIREVNLGTKTVSTLVEPNASVKTDNDNDNKVNLKSPWDLGFYDKMLMICAAGNHQIFGYSFEEFRLFGRSHSPNTLNLIAGTGREENRNNNYILKSSFAQPSGLCVSQVLNENDKIIYIADSESSSIRAVTSAGRVMGLVGGSRDPSDLFAFGDEDGCSLDVKLQHPMAVTSALGASKIFIADTFNHKVKMIDCESKHCSSLIGSTAGNSLGGFSGYVTAKKRSQNLIQNTPTQLALLNEPTGLAIDEGQNFLYIADTNNHCVKVANLRTRLVTELQLFKNAPHKTIQKFDQTYIINSDKAKLSIHNLPESFESGQWRLKSIGKLLKTGPISNEDSIGIIKLDELDQSDMILEVDIFSCTSEACYKNSARFNLLVNGNGEEVKLDFVPEDGFFIRL